MNQLQHFEQLYQAAADPWEVQTKWYERRKRQLLLAALPHEHYRHVFEPGCGNGETTLALLERCQQLTAADFSESAVQLCQARVDAQDSHRLHLQTLHIPAQWPAVPPEGFDLLVVSELAYYLNDEELVHFSQQCLSSLATGGHLLMCHWRHAASDRLQSTEALHRQMEATAPLERMVEHSEKDFLLHVWEKL